MSKEHNVIREERDQPWLALRAGRREVSLSLKTILGLCTLVGLFFGFANWGFSILGKKVVDIDHNDIQTLREELRIENQRDDLERGQIRLAVDSIKINDTKQTRDIETMTMMFCLDLKSNANALVRTRCSNLLNGR